jgi:methylmalonyl-CoA mutase
LDDPVTPLADGFSRATRADWTALVEKTLKGASPGSLISRTDDGLARAPLYTAPDSGGSPAPLARRDPAPGWDIRAAVRHPEAGRANTEALDALAGGAASVALSLDPTGVAGVAVGSADDLARVLDGVLIDVAPVALDAGFLGAIAADWLGAAAKAAPAAPLALNMDPLSAFAQAGASPGPAESHLIACATVGARLGGSYPKAGLFLASGRVVHEAGGTEAQEIAFAAASALAYAKALARAGAPMAGVFDRITLSLAVDADYFLSIAKLRAARLVWTRLTGACGVTIAARVEARSSGRMLTRADPWTNLIRLTAAGFASAVGGADVMVLGAFTDALGLPTAFAQRQARNTQLILMEEAFLGRVSDPAAGAWYLESLTHDLAAAAWTDFQAIAAAGGVIKALESGLIAREVSAARAALAARIAAGDLKIIGVTQFKNAEDAAVDVETASPTPADAPSPRLPGPDSRCETLTPVRLEELVA